MIKRTILIGSACLLLVACASAPAPRQIQNAFPIDGDYDSVWSAVVETFAELQLPIDNMEKDSGLITTDWIDFVGQTNEDYCDCGGLGINIEIGRTGKFNVFVKKVDSDSCEVRVNCQFQQTYKFGDTAFQRKCVSTGNLEAEMFQMFQEKAL